MEMYLQKIACFAPGIDDWQTMCSALTGKINYGELAAQQISKIVPQILPANERRRTTSLIKLALHVGEQATVEWPDGAQLASVFSSSDGDHDILNKSTHALTLPGRPVSPTNFHNSVHNAPAGYWAIAAKSQAFSTSLSVGDASFSGGLIEAATFSQCERQPVLFIAYEYPAQSVLQTVRTCQYPFAVAMLMTPVVSNQSQTKFEISMHSEKQLSAMDNENLEALRKDNPAARSLPLLACLAHKTVDSCTLEYVNNTRITLKVTPCQ